MMTFAFDARFLAALAAQAEAALGADHPMARAAAMAAESPGPQQAAALQSALDGLSDPMRDVVMQATHRQLREDLGAIWAQLPGAAQSGGMH